MLHSMFFNVMFHSFPFASVFYPIEHCVGYWAFTGLGCIAWLGIISIEWVLLSHSPFVESSKTLMYKRHKLAF